MDIEKGLLARDKRCAARLITLIENGSAEGIALLRELYPATGKALVIGVTGPPGVGKSTLIAEMVKLVRKQGQRVGVIAVDATSPFTGGAILGDRVRMSELNKDEGVFIRSLGSRGYLGGISAATGASVHVLDVFGCDTIFIETVGAGQSEVDIAKHCDTTIVLSVPGLGDDIQAIKAGMMEIADLFAVNKAHTEGAANAARHIEMMLDLSNADWRPPVVMVPSLDEPVFQQLWSAVLDHTAHMKETGQFETRRLTNKKHELVAIARQRLMSFFTDKGVCGSRLDELAAGVLRREIDPYSAVDSIIEQLGVAKHEPERR